MGTVLSEIGLNTENASVSLSPKLSLQEYFVDLLGGLVPGILFVAANCLVFFPGLHALLSGFTPSDATPSLSASLAAFLSAMKDTPSAIWLVLSFGGLLLSYTIGHLFYRHDPKVPDKKSFLRLKKRLAVELRATKKDASNTEATMDLDLEKALETHLGCSTEAQCEFPYPAYAEYLKIRGLSHLIPFIVWRDEDKCNHRSKVYINLLKIRLRYWFPEKCATIIRNEAHVRLASSSWYVSRSATWSGFFGVALAFSALLISLFVTRRFPTVIEAFAWHLPALVIPAIVILLAYYFMRSILGFFHYQRLREVFYVLETAYTAVEENPDLLLTPFQEVVDAIKHRKRTCEAEKTVPISTAGFRDTRL